MFERQEVIVTSRLEGSRKRKRGIEQPNKTLSASDLLTLQQQVHSKQMEVFSSQLQGVKKLMSSSITSHIICRLLRTKESFQLLVGKP